MAMQLAIEARGRPPGKTKAKSGQRAVQFVPHRAAAGPPTGRMDATTNVAVSGRSAPRPYRRNWGSRYGLVDGIVTMATIVGFAVALAAMAGEWLGTLTSSMPQPVATTVAPVAPATVAAGPTTGPRAEPGPL